jgi:hypothetical protein
MVDTSSLLLVQSLLPVHLGPTLSGLKWAGGLFFEVPESTNLGVGLGLEETVGDGAFRSGKTTET